MPEHIRNRAQAIQALMSGLKCDTVGCTYNDPTAELSWKGVRENLNRPCPLCGASLLTPEDARATRIVLVLITIMNIVCFPYMLLAWVFGWKENTAHCRLTMRGDGTVKCSEVEPHDK